MQLSTSFLSFFQSFYLSFSILLVTDVETFNNIYIHPYQLIRGQL